MTLKHRGIILSQRKTKVMVVGDDQVNTKIEIEGFKREKVRIVQYLGVRINGKGSQVLRLIKE